jgi:hypothetical protein
MKKIKITEKQAKLLETLNSKKVLKVTKEQYNRIIESELNRPSLTETPELHEEQINEDLFREFVNEIYGLNEEGKELRFEKLAKVMEAAGLIEGGKLVKEKFGKDARKVKEVVGKGLMKYEECGSVYEAVELMEAMTSDEIVKSFQNQLGKQQSNSNRPSDEEIKRSAYKQTIDTLGYDPKEELPNYPKGGKYNSQQIEELLDPNQDSMEFDEREHLDGKSAVGLAILNVPPFSELPETYADANASTLKLRVPSLEGGGPTEVTTKEFFKPHVVKQVPPYTHRPDHNYGGYIADFIELFGVEPEFTNIGEPYREGNSTLGAKINLEKAPKFAERIGMNDKAKSSFLSGERDKGNTSGLDEMTDSGAIANAQPIGPLNQKPIYKSNVNSELTSKIYEALKKK